MAHSRSPTQLDPGAAVAAWLWPGMGHLIGRQRKRGVMIMIGILFLFICGLLVGGVDCVDRKEDTLWFIAQVGCGPIVLGADFVNQSVIKKLPEEKRVRTISPTHPNEMGTLFIAMAGLMNVVVMLDALAGFPRRNTSRHRERRAKTS